MSERQSVDMYSATGNCCNTVDSRMILNSDLKDRVTVSYKVLLERQLLQFSCHWGF